MCRRFIRGLPVIDVTYYPVLIHTCVHFDGEEPLARLATNEREELYHVLSYIESWVLLSLCALWLFWQTLVFPDIDSYGHQLQVRQVREVDVLKQKAYMLFYVRDSIGKSVARKDNNTANLPMKKTPEKISSLNGITQSSVKAQNLNGVSPFSDKTHNTIIGSSSIFSKTITGNCSKNEVKAEDAPASQNNALPSTQPPGARNDGGTLPTKPMQFTVNSQETTSSHQPAPCTNTCGEQTVVGRYLQEMGPKADAGKHTSVVTTIANGATTLSKADRLPSQPQTEFAARSLSKKVCIMVVVFFLNNF